MKTGLVLVIVAFLLPMIMRLLIELPPLVREAFRKITHRPA